MVDQYVLNPLIEQGELEGVIPCLPIQEWFMRKDLKQRNHFNHSFLIRVDGRIETERLKSALDTLIRRHDMLRARYRGGIQTYRKESSVPAIRELDIRGTTEKAVYDELTSWQNRFDIEEGYIWQCGVIRGYDDGSERIFMAVHHLVFDAASWSILREDLKALYEGNEIEPKRTSYRQWVEAVKTYGENAAGEKPYWENARAEFGKHHSMWTEHLEKDADAVRFTRIELPEDIMTTLLRTSNGKVSELLLCGLTHALYELNGLKKNWIIMEAQGREAIDDRIDVSRTVGWFTTMYPFCLTVGKDMGETRALNGNTIRNVPHNGIGYGAIHGYDLLPKVLFNYLEELGGTAESRWQIRLGEPSGEGMSPDNRFGNVIDINGLTSGGKIRLGVESCLRENAHTLLCETFRKKLEAVAAYYEGRSEEYS